MNLNLKMNTIRLSKSVVGDEEKLAIARVIDAGYLGMGKEVQAFELELQQYLKTEHEVICVNTGTAALHLALQAIGVGPGDEVLVPSLTYVATFQAVSATGAKPVACDVTLDSVFIDLNDAGDRVTARTRAIIPVHYGSSTAGIDAVYLFAKERNLRVIEDAAHTFGCTHNGKKVGAIGDIVCFSFDGIKNITSGEGGAIVTGDRQLARKIKDSRLLGVEKDTDKRYAGGRSWAFDVCEQGWRYHMSNLMAAIGRSQLQKIDRFSSQRMHLAQRYARELCGNSDLVILNFDYENIVPHIFPVRILHGRRSEIIDALSEELIETGVHYQPNHQLSYYADGYGLTNSEALGLELLSLPLHPEITDEDQTRVIRAILKALLEI
jgi:dTDP-4-amino-4,6-dideoxygalactose transaminase